jgi:hypothetical protein
MKLKVDGHCVLLFLLLSRALKIVVFFRHEWQRSGQKLHVRQELLVVDPRHPEFTGTNLSASPFLAYICRRFIVRYLE